MGRGQGDGDIGTRVWGLGTWGSETRDLGKRDEGLEDIKYGTRRRVGRGRWDVKIKTGTQGTRDVNDYRESRR